MTEAYWETVFANEDPWDYSASDYETWKFEQTLSLLPKGRIASALELGCAEGHLTARLAPLVENLLALDISPTAIRRARERCAGFENVQFRVANLATVKLPANLDFILCSEVLFYLPLDVLSRLAPKIAAAVNPAGHLLLAHGNLITDDRSRTGFDWGHPFGAKTIAKVFAGLEELTSVAELETPLFTINLFRRRKRPSEKPQKPKSTTIPLPFDLEITAAVERCILWNGATTTRAEARSQERATDVPILMYHSVADQGPAELAPYRVSPAAFREQMRYLRHHGFHSITLEEWASSLEEKRPLPGRPVILTFDDGYRDFVENAWPILERTDFGATLFVVTEKVGGVADWDEHTAEPLLLMSWSDLAALRDKGVEIGSHSASHKDLATLSAAEAFGEGETARRTLQEKLGIDAKSIAFPWGRGEAPARQALARCGHRIGLTTWGGRSNLEDDPMNLPRIEIFGDDDIEAFATKLASPRAATELGADDETEATDALAEPIGFETDDRPAPAEDEVLPSRDSRVLSLTTETGTAERRFVNGGEGSLNPDHALRLAARLDALIGEFVKLQTQLLNALQPPLTLQKKLTALFAAPLTGRSSRALAPGDKISPGIRLSFEESAEVLFAVEPKTDHSLSPDTYLNTVELTFSGESPWLSFEIDLEWGDLSSAERFQLCVYGRPNRMMPGEMALRLPRQSGPPYEVTLTKFVLRADDRNAIVSGGLPMPDFAELDLEATPELLIFLDTESELTLTLHYLNAYFA